MKGTSDADSNSISTTVSKKKKTHPKNVTQSQDVPTVVDVDQDSSGEDEKESRPGKKADVMELLEYFGVPKHKGNKVGVPMFFTTLLSNFYCNHSLFNFLISSFGYTSIFLIL
ncbi:uncharacterized protein MELLADRAFT_95943 [Melampsora larici-populina 98AG31]|uniref:Uncharacterized protein n=1 Tax=Melampsora larici-populina (strain 98AG31 / pathotype 3-4-7) TaxID=747676 RepID=F4RDU5_MELLP|nr:uncharacterized protein MELLADRAFT_95943 [Melampsora larici-populina 98AG31]EGG09463.1 hypothetical protein MELLADRAFT_95943 [Melampsora larici-populina 98AG31]